MKNILKKTLKYSQNCQTDITNKRCLEFRGGSCNKSTNKISNMIPSILICALVWVNCAKSNTCIFQLRAQFSLTFPQGCYNWFELTPRLIQFHTECIVTQPIKDIKKGVQKWQ